MYWTRHSGYILQGSMDGSSVRTLVSGLVQPCGIQFDYGTKRIYWASEDGKRIQSSNEQGSNLRSHVNTMQRPFGMAVLNGWLYWSHYSSRSVAHSTLTGDDHYLLFMAPANVRQIDVPNGARAISRTNPCESLNCSKMCILTSGKSARCLG